MVLSIIFVSCRIIILLCSFLVTQSGARGEFPLACLSSRNPLSGSIFVIYLRWTALPKMSKESCRQSALFIGNGDDDAAVLVVGGRGGNHNEAALLTNRPHQGREEQGSGCGDPWRWQQLSPMREKRWNGPGILLLERERVLVVGDGFWGSKTAEVLQLPHNDNDRGVWTLLTQPLTRDFYGTFLVNFNNRIVAVGELLINLVYDYFNTALVNHDLFTS